MDSMEANRPPFGEYDHPDMPLGLGMALSQNIEALQNFAKLDMAHQREIIGFVQASTTGEEAKARVTNAVRQLQMGEEHPRFF